MPGAVVTLNFVDVNEGGRIRKMQYWSDDGTVTGNLSLSAGGIPGMTQFQLALNVASLAINAETAVISGIPGGTYIWSSIFAGASTLSILTLGPDGTTWQTFDSVTATGSKMLVLGNNCSIKLKNTGAAVITALSSSLS